MQPRRVTRNLTTGLLVGAAGAALFLLWASRRQSAEATPVIAVEQDHTPAPSLSAPAADSLDADAALTAVPRVTSQLFRGADDEEAIGADELGAAFLARATDSSGYFDEAEQPVDSQMPGFQIATLADLTTPELSDESIDFELPSERDPEG